MVEHNLAKVGVASSNLVSRSNETGGLDGTSTLTQFSCATRRETSDQTSVSTDISIIEAGWQSGHAADCNSVYAGSIPTPASISERLTSPVLH